MALINYTSKEITLKIVYYGPGLSGKTTNLQHLHSSIAPDRKGKLLSLATETDRTLFFDFMPLTVGKVGDFTVKFQLYTVPGQVRYDATRKLVLKGADAIVFVADSQTALREQNIESYQNMLDNLRANNLNPDDIPTVIQYNKRDLDDILSINNLNKDINSAGHKTVAAEAINGEGVDETLKLVTKLIISHIAAKHRIGFAPPKAEKSAAPAAPKKTEKPPREKKPSPEPPPPPAIEEPPEEEITTVTIEEIPEMPALSELSEYSKLESMLEELDSKTPSGLPSMEEFSSRTKDASLPSSPPASSSISEPISPDGLGQAVAGIRSALEDISRSANAAQRAVSELASELKESRKNQKEMIALLKEIAESIGPAGKPSKRG